MATTDDAILQALATLTEEVRDGFKRMDEKEEQQNKRIAKSEQDIVRLKTIWTSVSIVVGFFFHVAKDYFVTAFTAGK